MTIIKGTNWYLVGALLLVSVIKEYNNIGNFSNEEVYKVFNKLAVNSGTQAMEPLVILDSPLVNAWTDGEKITITTSLLKIMKNEDELALVLGHEMSHVLNYDVIHMLLEDGWDVKIDSRYKEAAADKMGALIMMRAGYDVCRGKEIMRTFKDNFGDDAGAEGHPDNAFRLDQLDLPQCHRGLSWLLNW